MPGIVVIVPDVSAPFPRTVLLPRDSSTALPDWESPKLALSVTVQFETRTVPL
jgi:hypothetical protein